MKLKPDGEKLKEEKIDMKHKTKPNGKASIKDDQLNLVSFISRKYFWLSGIDANRNKKQVVQLKCHGINFVHFCHGLLHLLFLILGYCLLSNSLCLHLMFCVFL